MMRSHSDAQLAARHDPSPWVHTLSGARFDSESPDGFGNTGVVPLAIEHYTFEPRIKMVPVQWAKQVYYDCRHGIDSRDCVVCVTVWTTVGRPPVNRLLSAIRDDVARFDRLAIDRKYVATIWLGAISMYHAFGGYTSWDSPEHPYHVFTNITDAEVEFARVVLERTANLQSKEKI